MTNTVSTNIRAKKKLTYPRSSRGGAAVRAFFYVTERSLSTGDIPTKHPPARNSRSQTSTPGPSRTQSVPGGDRASALHAVGRVPLVAPLPASPAVP